VAGSVGQLPSRLSTFPARAAIAAPTLVVASGKDHSEYMNTAQQVARLIPNSGVVEMAQVRHWPAFEDPETFNAAALRFLRG
jgi:2-hydroxy-6-oxonona-2,4-dienedioate hydrolase